MKSENLFCLPIAIFCMLILLFLTSSAFAEVDPIAFTECVIESAVDLGIGLSPLAPFATLACTITSSTEADLLACVMGYIPFVGEGLMLLEFADCISDTGLIPGSDCNPDDIEYYCANNPNPPWFCDVCLDPCKYGGECASDGGQGPKEFEKIY